MSAGSGPEGSPSSSFSSSAKIPSESRTRTIRTGGNASSNQVSENSHFAADAHAVHAGNAAGEQAFAGRGIAGCVTRDDPVQLGLCRAQMFADDLAQHGTIINGAAHIPRGGRRFAGETIGQTPSAREHRAA